MGLIENLVMGEMTDILTLVSEFLEEVEVDAHTVAIRIAVAPKDDSASAMRRSTFRE